MAQLIADRRDIDFVLYEQFDAESLPKFPKYQEFNRKMFDMIITEARNFGLKEILPTFAQSDRDGVRYENGKVMVSECFRRPHQLFVEGEWLAIREKPEVGGQGLPHLITQAAYEYLVGSNYAFIAFGTLGHGAGKLIELYGTPDQKSRYLKKLYAGEWGGSMLLTEPQAGSDVGALTTSAVKNPDGTYSISGAKIFITNGDQNLTDNIIHPVLARIEGAPAGTKGISLFIVPKIWVNPDGSLGDFNDVVCTGVEHKMGLHGSPTCSMTLGGKGRCRGFLLGNENQGMQIMFHMMNEARLDVGAQGFTHASAAYLYALNYARQRLQGKDITGARDAQGQAPIIRHPDVRRMLIMMKAYVEGMRSFVYYVARCFDRKSGSGNPEEQARWSAMTELLTPVVKAYCSERGFDVCTQAVQVYGGYGYTQEYPVEQLLRDCKITSIYEGANGIQAMDLLGRKLAMKNGAVFNDLIQEMRATIQQAHSVRGLEPLAAEFETAMSGLVEIAGILVQKSGSKDVLIAFAFSHPFMEIMGDVIMAWMLLWRGSIARPKLETIAGGADSKRILSAVQNDRNASFYDGQVKTATWFIQTILPVTMGKIQAVKAGCDAAVTMDEKSFGGF
ncbi:MAG: acyl-CoA dehydrogenase [Desulfatirhabdiaceae bacterium]